MEGPEMDPRMEREMMKMADEFFGNCGGVEEAGEVMENSVLVGPDLRAGRKENWMNQGCARPAGTSGPT